MTTPAPQTLEGAYKLIEQLRREVEQLRRSVEHANRRINYSVAQEWQIVPLKPTAIQVAKGIGAICRAGDTMQQAEAAYEAMLAAAPTYPTPGVPTEEEIEAVLIGACEEAPPLESLTPAQRARTKFMARAILKLLTEKGEKNG